MSPPRPRPDLHWETSLWAQGFRVVVGLDEAGRGAWAGPVAAAAVALPHHAPAELAQQLCKVCDSKQLLPAQRERLLPLIEE